MALAALAILGHKSAHSFPIGPVIAEPSNVKAAKYKISFIEDTTTTKQKIIVYNPCRLSLPFISPFGFTITPALSGKSKIKFHISFHYSTENVKHAAHNIRDNSTSWRIHIVRM